MGYYKVLEYRDDRKYVVEGLNDGSQREMRIKYADIVRVKEDDCQIIEGVSLPGYVPASKDLHFVAYGEDKALYPLEQKLCALSETASKRIKVGDIAELTLKNQTTFLCRVDSTSAEKSEITITRLGDSDRQTISLNDIIIPSIKVLADGYRYFDDDVLVMKWPNGVYYPFDAVAKAVWYDSVIAPGQIVKIESKKDFALTDVARELGVKLPDVIRHIANVLPDNYNNGRGIQVDKPEDTILSISEFYRLTQYLKRPETQFKSIIHWEYYVSKRFNGIPKPKFLEECDPYRCGVPYQNLDMERFVNLVEWLDNKKKLEADIVSYFPLFPLLYWWEQIRFVIRVVVYYKSGQSNISDLNLLERLVEYPQQVNINVLIFIHSIIKLHREKTTLSNAELFHIWKSNQPNYIDGEFGLALNDYIGTHLFCTCHGALGFNVEDWWLPNVNAENKPVLYIYGNGDVSLRANGNNDVKSTIESVKQHKGFVVIREDDNREEKSCFESNQCPVLRAICEDTERRDEYLKAMNISQAEFEKNANLSDLFTFNYCPLVSVPSWRNKWAEKHRDKCISSKQPRIKYLYLWHKRNTKQQHTFCEGILSKELHQKANLPFSWCGGNACFADRYAMPEVAKGENNTSNAGIIKVDIYTSAVYLNLLENNNQSKWLLQRFHARLNWLNATSKHLYCRSCNHILEVRQTSLTYDAHTVSRFSCQTEGCVQRNKEIYLSHCWNDRCRGVIDSRDTSQCPNHKYICPSCGVCCGEKMFELKRQAGVPYKSAQYHYEQGTFFCYRCGKEMTRQGHRYYCSDHPGVVTTPPRSKK